MSTLRTSSFGRGSLAGLADRLPGGPRNGRVTLAALTVILGATITAGIMRSQRVAAWAPVDVVQSRDPLQELPIRVAGQDGVVRPAHTHDAVLDLKSISNLVLGVDLDYVPKGAPRYEVVIRTEAGRERFRDAIAARYFDEGRFMLRLFSRKFPNGDYMLEIEAVESETDKRVVAASWFQVHSS